MTRRKRFSLITAGSIVGGLVALVIAALLVAQSSWFRNIVKEKAIAAIEDSTGGRVEIGSFSFDPWHLDIQIRNLVLHGTEPPTAAPLARISLLEARLKLLAGFKKVIDLAYLGISEPQVDFIVNADGTTNLPSPKVKQPPSQTSPLEPVVNLAINEFRITNGLLLYSQRASNFSAQGQDLHALLNYNTFTSSYEGHLLINPLTLSLGSGTPLRVQVNLPVLVEKNAISISGAQLATDASQILVNAGIRKLNSPIITARVNANLSLAELQRSFDLPIDTASSVPKALTADVNARYDDSTSSIALQTAHIVLGQTNFDASGTLVPSRNQAVQFHGKLALDQLSRLAKLTTTSISGALLLRGQATMDAQKNYALNGDLTSQQLGITSGTTSLTGISLSSPFHVDPYLISLDGLKLNVLGGDLAAKIFIEKMQQLSVESRLNNFTVSQLSRVFAGHPIGYDGSINGTLRAKSNLQARGTTGFTAETHFRILPGNQGVPLDGRIDGRFNGATGVIALDKSYVVLPNSRIDLSGDINQQLSVSLISHNLDDFLPAANFGAAKQLTSLPVSLAGGTARLNAQIQGNLSAPNIQAHAAVDHLAVRGTPMQHVGLDLAASPSHASISNGVVTSQGLDSTFDASIGLFKWKPLPQSPVVGNVSVPHANLANILAVAGQNNLPASGTLNAQVHINGTYGDPLGSASVQAVKGVAYNQPFDNVQASVNLAHQLITLSNLEIDAAGGQLLADGTFSHPVDSFQTGHAEFHIRSNNVQLANIQALQERSPGTAGVLKLTADGAGNVRNTQTGSQFQLSNISTDFSAHSLAVRNQAAGDLSAQARTSNGTVAYNVHSDFAGSTVHINGATSLTGDYSTKAAASIRNLSVQRVLAITGQTDIPAMGTLSLDANLSGTIKNPDVQGNVALSKAVLYSEPVNDFKAQVHYSNTLLDISSLNLDVPAGTLSASGQYNHSTGDLYNGWFQLRLNSSDIDLSKIKHLVQLEPGVAGGLKLVADIAGNVHQKNGSPEVFLSDANADINAHSLRANGQELGELHAVAKTQQHVVKFDLESNLAHADLRASGQTRLGGNYVTQAKVTFGNIRYANIAPFIPSDDGAKPAFDALVDGEATVDGPMLDPAALNGRLQLNQLDVKTSPQSRATGAPGPRVVELRNDGPAIITLKNSVLTVQQLKIQGGKTYLQAGGSISLKSPTNALGLTLKGSADLGILQNADRDFYSSGDVVLDAVIRGSFAKPLVNGRILLQNANVNYTDASNGLSNGNGVILLNGTTATIQTLTGESGGGKISVAGFAGITPTEFIFNLHATANKVRTRYSGVSITSNADITLAGGTRRSTVSGTVTVQRIAYSSTSDAGSILSSASVPSSTPTAPSPLLSGLRLDVRIITAPDLRVVTTYAEKLSVTSNLTLRGTAQNPGMIGRLSVTNGNLVFFGNTYTVNTGTINFYNPNTIQPILDLSLETIAQGVDVTLGVRGPIDDLKLSYRSDPPLTFEQIVQLLATNTTPSDPTIAAHQPTPPQQSVSQMGESAILGQAVANPLASRVQRVFGLTQFKIDPSLSGSNGQPSARVTLQQKIASNLTFTYITDVTQTNSEIVRVELDLTPRVSAVGLRDYNGNVSVEFFYKFQKR